MFQLTSECDQRNVCRLHIAWQTIQDNRRDQTAVASKTRLFGRYWLFGRSSA